MLCQIYTTSNNYHRHSLEEMKANDWDNRKTSAVVRLKEEKITYFVKMKLLSFE